MADEREKARLDRTYRRLLSESFKRLRRRGLSETEAGEIAREVAERSLQRLQTPEYRTEREFADAVGRVCGRLSAGVSYYTLIGEMPFLATARIDRVVGVAGNTNPPVEPGAAAAAKRAIRVEKLSGGIVLLFAGLALGTLGLWYALGVGLALAVLGEIYAQAFMPASIRKAMADMWMPPVIIAAGGVVVVYFGYRWIVGDHPRGVLVALAAVAILFLAFLVPGLTLARMVGRRERRRRKDLENKLSK